MKNYTSGDLEGLLHVKNHVLRYWTGEMPLVQPRKDSAGRVFYSGRDVRLLLRLKYLLYERHFTIEGARARLEAELSGDRQDLRAELDALRSQLVDLFFLVRKGG
ncbi:MAG: MerR family transcriptional regulator [Treponema sp.]|jgi:DNA-binding transcriptional MerR regulator|nr:MerR family transcriptional regulator [Treponema sp.]